MFNRFKKLYSKENYTCGINVRAKRNSAKSGSTLLVVIIASAVAVSLLAAVMTSILSANVVSLQNSNANQAYFTARSAVNTITQCITDNQNLNPSLVGDLVTDTSTPYTIPGLTGMGTATVKVEYWNSISNVKSSIATNEIKITGTGLYNGVTRTASAYVNNNYIGPFSYLSFNTGDVVTFAGLNNVVFDGDIFSSTNVIFSSTSSIKKIRSITAMQAVTLDGNCNVQNYVKCGNNLELDGSNTIGGNAYSKGEFDIARGGAGVVNGNVYSQGNVNLNGNNTYQILKRLYCTNTPVNYARVKVSPINGYKDFSLKDTTSFYKSAPLPTLANNITINSGVLADGTIVNNVISSSGNWDNSTYPIAGPTRTSYNKDRTYIVDTRSGDITLYFNSLNEIDLNNVKFEIYGPNHLYIYLNNTFFNFDPNCYIGMYDTSNKAVKAYIFQTNDVSSLNGTINACIYAPDIQVTLSSGLSFTGSIVAKKTVLNSNTTVAYSEPDTTGTPLEDILNAAKAAGDDSANWETDHWLNS